MQSKHFRQWRDVLRGWLFNYSTQHHTSQSKRQATNANRGAIHQNDWINQRLAFHIFKFLILSFCRCTIPRETLSGYYKSIKAKPSSSPKKMIMLWWVFSFSGNKKLSVNALYNPDREGYPTNCRLGAFGDENVAGGLDWKGRAKRT